MRKIFKTQKAAAVIYAVMSVAVLLYTLLFMTEYKDLFGLKLKQNSQVSIFHDSILQTFNRQIFALALFGIIVIALSFFLEIFHRVPDWFALVVLEACLIGCCVGAVYAITNIQAVETFYRNLDMQYLYLEGLDDYQLKFTTFRVGIGIYVAQLAVCIAYGSAMLASHITYKKIEKKGRMENG